MFDSWEASSADFFAAAFFHIIFSHYSQMFQLMICLSRLFTLFTMITLSLSDFHCASSCRGQHWWFRWYCALFRAMPLPFFSLRLCFLLSFSFSSPYYLLSIFLPSSWFIFLLLFFICQRCYHSSSLYDFLRLFSSRCFFLRPSHCCFFRLFICFISFVSSHCLFFSDVALPPFRDSSKPRLLLRYFPFFRLSSRLFFYIFFISCRPERGFHEASAFEIRAIYFSFLFFASFSFPFLRCYWYDCRVIFIFGYLLLFLFIWCLYDIFLLSLFHSWLFYVS